jgi:hypothetical protein
MATTVKVVGEERLQSTLRQAAKQLGDIDTTAAAATITAAVPSAAPRRTGRLAGSFTSGKGTITSPLVYAVPIHWGRPAHNIEANPFVYRAADHAEARWSADVEKAGQKICDEVEGA